MFTAYILKQHYKQHFMQKHIIVYNYKDVEFFFFLKKRLVTDYYCDIFIVSPLQFHRVE